MTTKLDRWESRAADALANIARLHALALGTGGSVEALRSAYALNSIDLWSVDDEADSFFADLDLDDYNWTQGALRMLHTLNHTCSEAIVARERREGLPPRPSPRDVAEEGRYGAPAAPAAPAGSLSGHGHPRPSGTRKRTPDHFSQQLKAASAAASAAARNRRDLLSGGSLESALFGGFGGFVLGMAAAAAASRVEPEEEPQEPAEGAVGSSGGEE